MNIEGIWSIISAKIAGLFVFKKDGRTKKYTAAYRLRNSPHKIHITLPTAMAANAGRLRSCNESMLKGTSRRAHASATSMPSVAVEFQGISSSQNGEKQVKEEK